MIGDANRKILLNLAPAQEQAVSLLLPGSI